MRIIAGRYKGKKLLSLKGMATRPTSGKTREAVFNIIGDRISEAMVLDLFAGTGAFGLEAISRGAAGAVFIDSERRAVDLIRKNVAACRVEPFATVICWNILRNLRCLAGIGQPFDLVFIDPPYDQNAVLPALDNLVETGALAPGALIIVEHGLNETLPDTVSGLTVTDRRKYGRTRITFLTNCVTNSESLVF